MRITCLDFRWTRVFAARGWSTRANFIAQWPDPKTWFSEPLPVRIGCLVGDTQAFPTYPVSFRARSYLYFLALTDRTRLDYDFLFAVGNMRVAETLAPLNAYFGLDELVADSGKIGYSERGMRSSLHGTLPRVAMHMSLSTQSDGFSAVFDHGI